MPSLTTQSIGTLGAPLANSAHAVQLARASQAGVQAGVQQNHNAVRAIHSATDMQQRSKRPIQAEARPARAFEEDSQDGSENSDGDSQNKQGTPRIDTAA